MIHSLQQRNLLPEQTELISRVYQTLKNDEFLQSYLIVGARHLITAAFIQALVKGMLCASECGICKNCKLIESMQHPDVIYITNNDSNIIKIDSVRDLHLNVYQSLSIAKHKIVAIYPADKLNIQAASALLKILEEPPKNIIFILIAENLMTLPVTIISRCHKYFMQDYSLNDNYFEIARYYPENDERFILLANIDKFLNKILDLTNNKLNVCEIATDLQEFKLENVLWFLYLFTAETLKLITTKQNTSNVSLLNDFAKTQNLFSLYKQLDKIQSSLRANLANITLNNTLCISNLLLGYKSC